MSLHTLTLAQAAEKVRRKEVSSVDLVKALLVRIREVDPRVQAFLDVNEEDALEQARLRDRESPSGALHGVPVLLKDNMNRRGTFCSCGSKILNGYRAPYNATVVERLEKAGAVFLGRANMDEFAMGSSTENSAMHATRNPWDLERIPGGSSGGCAAAVASDMAFGSLGSDTGGSIRQPAAVCGCVGLKPTYGRVSRYGLVAFASSLDQIGPITKDARDAALLLQTIAGHDPRDSTSLPDAVPDYSKALEQGIKGLRMGLPKEYFAPGLDPQVEKLVRAAVEELRQLGAELVEISLPHTPYAVAVYYVIATAEASANLARFDGVRYGHRTSEPSDLLDLYGRTRAEGFGPEVKRRIILGTYVLSSGYYDAYYLRAQKVRTLIRRDFGEAFKKCDFILTPTSPTPAFKLGEKANDPLQMYLADICTIAANLAGICGISVPCGRTGGAGKPLPVGLQFLGPSMGEETLFRVAGAYEQVCRWDRNPGL
ncbi:MAG: Asp-tRNA(Asn)/Glu-tRNA(Gln) amidotransferase subunit GatA [Verrucomicrobiae bacterium]|nr:Asp-tRNA(Asn)/Glu-tRNA(Gln) amidotransferase subunit GatA [Verrucomicrobiae bacterium]